MSFADQAAHGFGGAQPPHAVNREGHDSILAPGVGSGGPGPFRGAG
jgi:hypothetical protein